MQFAHKIIGKCIYCGSTAPPLTREHVLPRGLGGNLSPSGTSEALVLQKASCIHCQRITQQIERACLKDMFDPLRLRLDMKRKDRLEPTARILVRDLHGRTEERDVAHKHVLGAMVIPAFRAAKLFAAGVPIQGPDVRAFWPERADELPDPDIHSIGVRFTCHPDLFARMLAKIAHGFAIARLGVEGFIPLVPPLIRGDTNDWQKFVGGFCEELASPPKQDVFHQISLRQHEGFWTVDIQLFAEYGTPINYVVVGRQHSRITRSTTQRLMSHSNLLVTS